MKLCGRFQKRNGRPFYLVADKVHATCAKDLFGSCSMTNSGTDGSSFGSERTSLRHGPEVGLPLSKTGTILHRWNVRCRASWDPTFPRKYSQQYWKYWGVREETLLHRNKADVSMVYWWAGNCTKLFFDNINGLESEEKNHALSQTQHINPLRISIATNEKSWRTVMVTLFSKFLSLSTSFSAMGGRLVAWGTTPVEKPKPMQNLQHLQRLSVAWNWCLPSRITTVSSSSSTEGVPVGAPTCAQNRSPLRWLWRTMFLAHGRTHTPGRILRWTEQGHPLYCGEES